MKFLIILAVLATAVVAQDVEFGGLCNGLLLQCNRHSNTVACMSRDATNTCATGAGVDLGRCQCTRNCVEGVYVEHGEFDLTRDICVGFVGQLCTGLVPDVTDQCTAHATCNFLTSKCVCGVGYVVDPTGLRCIAG